jgi:hypothetical protein
MDRMIQELGVEVEAVVIYYKSIPFIFKKSKSCIQAHQSFKLNKNSKIPLDTVSTVP